MRLFIAGATGYTGNSMLRLLTANGPPPERVTAHVRPGSASLPSLEAAFGPKGVHIATAPWEAPALEAALAESAPAAVFALLGTTRARAKQAHRHGEDASYAAVDVGLTLLLLEACRAARPEARFVYLSSVGADPNSRSAYLRARGEVEEALKASGQPFTIARPSFITGPDRPEPRPAERLGAAVAGAALGLSALLGARRFAARYRAMRGAELAEALLLASEDPACASAILHADDLRALLRTARPPKEPR